LGRRIPIANAPESRAGTTASSALALFAIGLVSLLAQVVLLRELLVAAFGSELVYLAAFAVLLSGTAAGAALSRRMGGSPARVARLLLLASIALPLLATFARLQRGILGGTTGTLLSPLTQLSGLAITLLPFGLLAGMLFVGAARVHIDRGGTPGGAYAWESAGGIAGGAAATVLLAAGISNAGAAFLTLFLGAGAVALLPGSRILRGAGAAVALTVVVAVPFLGTWDRALTARQHPDLVATADTPYGRLTVQAGHGQVVIFENDGLVSESEGTSAEEFVHPAALQVASPRKVLLVGGALEGLAAEVLKHHPEKVDALEVDGRALEVALPHLPPSWREAMESPHVGLRVQDPRLALGSGGPWDLVLVGMPEPDSGLTNRYYSREFFEACSARMAPGAVLALRLRAAENLWTPLLVRRTASVSAALGEAFSHQLILPGSTVVLLASQSPLETDPQKLAARLAERSISARLVRPAYLRYLLTNDRLAEIRRTLAGAPYPPNADARPVCYPLALSLWASRLAPSLGHWAPQAVSPRRSLLAGSLIGVALALAGLLLPRRGRARAMLLVTGAGAGGMMLEGALLLAYQVRQGVLFQDLGLLVTAFMAGLALGSWAASRAGVRGAATASLLLLGGCSLVAALLWYGSWWPGRLLTVLLMTGAGIATGALFASAARWPDSGPLGSLYAADLSGGVLGALAAGLVLIPFAGLPDTALLVGLLAVALLPLSR